jgi:hypothetical protein
MGLFFLSFFFRAFLGKIRKKTDLCFTNVLRNGEPLNIDNERQTITLNPNGNFSKKEFQELWNKIGLKTI